MIFEIYEASVSLYGEIRELEGSSTCFLIIKDYVVHLSWEVKHQGRDQNISRQVKIDNTFLRWESIYLEHAWIEGMLNFEFETIF